MVKNREYKVRVRGGQKRRFYKFICAHCDEAFWREWRGNARKPKFCSRVCYRADCKMELVTLHCANCNAKFERRKTSLKNSRSGLYFCSRKCKDESQRIGGIMEIRPPQYRDGRSHYRQIAFREQERKCADCGYDEYKEVLVVHHIDRNRKNNNSDNLVILCPTCHRIRHHKIRNNIKQ